MKYCADTWFILEVLNKNQNGMRLFNESKTGNNRIIVPIVVYAESIKKSMQLGLPINQVSDFFETAKILGKIFIYSPNEETAKEAAKISLTNNLALIDSFVAATSKLMGCDILLAKDNDYKILEKKKYLKVMNW